MTEYFYRYDDVRYAAPLNEYDEPVGTGRVDVLLSEYPVLKHTPKGVQLDMMFGATRFVLLSARKKFACATKAEALESFLARKKRQVAILEAQLRRVNEAVQLVEKGRVDRFESKWVGT